MTMCKYSSDNARQYVYFSDFTGHTMSKWPNGANKEIFIRQDNAIPHIKDMDEGFNEELRESGMRRKIG